MSNKLSFETFGYASQEISSGWILPVRGTLMWSQIYQCRHHGHFHLHPHVFSLLDVSPKLLSETFLWFYYNYCSEIKKKKKKFTVKKN